MQPTYVWLVALVAATHAQREGEPERTAPVPAIISHRQALTTDGAFNFAFAADNGLQQGETINPDGSRTGAYSYVDPSGRTIRLRYSAGKDGFKVLEGDHLPKSAPLGEAPPQPPPSAQHYPHRPAPVQYQAPQQYQSPANPPFRPQPPALPSSFRQQQYQAPTIPSGFRPQQYQAPAAPNGQYQPPTGITGAFPRVPPNHLTSGQEGHRHSFTPPSSPGNYFQSTAPIKFPRGKPAPVPQQDLQPKDEKESNEPHSFGDGYAFEIQG